MAEKSKTAEEIQEKPAQKAIAKHRKLDKKEIAALKSTAPEGKLELAPGKTFSIGPRNFKSALFSIQPGKDGKEELKRDRKKSCYVPEIMLKGIKVKEGTFLGK